MNLHEAPIAKLLSTAREQTRIAQTEGLDANERRKAEVRLREVENVILSKLQDKQILRNASLDVQRAQRMLTAATLAQTSKKIPQSKIDKFNRRLREVQRVEQSTASIAVLLSEGSQEILDAALGRKNLSQISLSLQPFAASLGAT